MPNKRLGLAVGGISLSGLAALAIAVQIPAASTAAGRQAASATPDARQIWLDAQEKPRAYDLLRELTTQIGPRLTGTAKAKAAEDWGLRQFRSAGYADAHFVPFSFERWVRGPLSLTVDGKTIPAMAFGASPAKADFTGEIVEIANGIDADYDVAPERVRGKIVLAYSTVLPDSPDETPFLMRWDKIKLAVKHGAKALVFINRGKGNLLSTGQGWLEGRLPIPVMMIGHDEGLALRARLKGGALPAQLKMTNDVRPGQARNVVAILPGTDPKAEKIVFGAHLDSWDLATGALDNGAGATSVIDLARLFKQKGYRPRRTIEFVLYMGEEQGDLGSIALVRSELEHPRGPRVGYAINSDMSYDTVALNTWGFPADQAFFGGLVQELKALDAGFSTEVATRPMPGGDPQSYAEQGIPVVYLMGRGGEEAARCQHSPCDRLDIIKPDTLRRTTAISAVTLFRLANAAQLPAPHLSGAELESYLVKNGLKQ